MLGLLQSIIEKFDANKYPHEYPDEMRTRFIRTDLDHPKRGAQDQYAANHDHIRRYLDINKGYFTLYDLAVYIIVFVFMFMFCREIVLNTEDQSSAYMYICLVILGICAVLY